MSDYILEMKMEMLKDASNEFNHLFEAINEKELEDLKDSIDKINLLEPITITPNNTIISGHRRFQQLRNLVETIDCRLSNFENTLIAIVELNRYRKKTASELLRESEVLNEEYKKTKWDDLIKERFGLKTTVHYH